MVRTMSETTPAASTTLMLNIALAADIYALYRIYDTREVSYAINHTSFGPHTFESAPLIFCAIVAFHVLIAIVIMVYLWMGWEPPESDAY